MSQSLLAEASTRCAFFLAEFIDGKITNLDGCHGGPEDVAKALKLYRRLGFFKPEATYRMLQVHDVPDLDPPINEEAAAQCRTVLDHYRTDNV